MAETLDRHDGAGLQGVAAPALTHQSVRRPELEIPIDYFAIVARRIDVEARMRVSPFEKRDRAGQSDRAIRIVFGTKSMMCIGRCPDQNAECH